MVQGLPYWRWAHRRVDHHFKYQQFLWIRLPAEPNKHCCPRVVDGWNCFGVSSSQVGTEN